VIRIFYFMCLFFLLSSISIWFLKAKRSGEKRKRKQKTKEWHSQELFSQFLQGHLEIKETFSKVMLFTFFFSTVPRQQNKLILSNFEEVNLEQFPFCLRQSFGIWLVPWTKSMFHNVNEAHRKYQILTDLWSEKTSANSIILSFKKGCLWSNLWLCWFLEKLSANHTLLEV
jgi:hypothetical protein